MTGQGFHYRSHPTLFMQANTVIASTFLLYAVGLGSTGAIPTAGALSWVLKDGLGQLGTLVAGKWAHGAGAPCRVATWLELG